MSNKGTGKSYVMLYLVVISSGKPLYQHAHYGCARNKGWFG